MIRFCPAIRRYELSFLEGMSETLKTIAETVASPFTELQPDNGDTDPDTNNSFELAATAVEAAGSIPVRAYKTVGDALDKVTGRGTINMVVMVSYMGLAVVPGYAAVLPMWLLGAALRGIGDKLDS